MKNRILFRNSLMGGAIILLLSFFNPLSAQNCTWQDSTVGTTASGTATYNNCDPITAAISATAYTASLTSDEENFVYRELCGDGELVVQMSGLNPTNGQYGIEFRSGLDAGAMKFGLKKTGTGFFITKMSRDAVNSPASYLPAINFTSTWFKITRTGDTFSAYTSSDGATWLLSHTMTIQMPTCIMGGMLVHDANGTTEVDAQFDGIDFVGGGPSPAELLCGWEVRSTSTDSLPAEYSDRFDNLYTRGEVTIPGYATSSSGQGSEEKSFDGCGCEEFGITTDYFDLWFEDCLYTTTGFNDPILGSDRRKVACQVFAEIAQMIALTDGNGCNTATDRKVNVRFQPHDDVNGTGDELELPVAGVASAYYWSYKEHQDGLPWTIINTGEIPLDWVTLYHGRIRINYDAGINWWTDVSQNPPAGFGDLYTVIWHEALHFLGFSSQATTSIHYTRFDRSLHLTNYPNGSTLPLIEVSGFNWAYPTGVNPLTDFYSGCQNPNVLGPDMEFHSNTGGVYPILADDSSDFLTGSSHSHLKTDCDNNATSDFVMAPSLPSGVRRTITSEEIDILCTLGYNTNLCGCTVSGADDFGPNCNEIYQISLCETLTINLADLISNDDSDVTGISFLDIRNDSYGQVVDNENGTYTFTPTVMGLAVLSYIPTGCADDREGNFTNIYIQVIASSDCPETYTCNDLVSCEDLAFENCLLIDNCPTLSSCNLICNAGLCGTVYANSNSISSPLFNFPYITRRGNSIIPNWVRTHGTPDILTGGFTNSIARVGGQSAEVIPGTDIETLASLSEGVMTTVSIEEGNYLFAFKYFLVPLLPGDNISTFKVDVIEASQIQVPIDFHSSPAYTGAIENIFTFGEETTGSFTKVGTCFTIGENSPLNALWFHVPAPLLSGYSGAAYFDDVELIPDDFDLGEDISPAIPCGTSVDIGGDFCMLSGVGIDYQWFDLSANPNVPILEYTVLDGDVIGTVNNPNNLPFDPDTRILTVTLTGTTTYRLVRTVNADNDGGLPNLFPDNCSREADEITINVIGTIPNADFSIIEADCEYTFLPHPFFVSPEYAHIWVFGTIGASNEPFPPNVSFPVGTHVITHIVSNGNCETTSTQTITITAPVAEFSYMADCSELHFMANAPDLATYEWDFGDNSLGSGANPLHSYTREGSYLVSLTVTDECGLMTIFSLDVETESCPSFCNCDIGINIDGGTQGVLLSTLIQPNGPFPPDGVTNTCIAINGLLIVDVDNYTITGGELRMGEGAEIRVGLGANEFITLSLQNITQGGGIHGCDNMWRGINVYEDATLIMSHCTIEDARYAISPEHKSTVNVSNTTFNDNYVGLHAEDVGYLLLPFYGNTFQNVTGFLPPYAGQTPVVAAGQMPYAGIEYTYSTSGSIPLFIGVEGTFFPPNNVFRNMQNGIILNGDIQATIINTYFHNLQPDFSLPTSSYPFKGFGIRLEGLDNATLFQRPFLFVSSFFNCRTGIWTRHADVDIKYNSMSKVNTGIEVQMADMANIDIANNIIKCSRYGISLLHNDAADNLLVYNNRITLGEIGTLVKGAGINVLESKNRVGEKAFIELNTIHLPGSGGEDGFSSRGISINSVNELGILDNIIYCEAADAVLGNAGNIGIYHDNGLDNIFDENQVYGTGLVSDLSSRKTGMKITDCTNTRYSCNYFEHLHTGVHFTSGTSTDTDLRTTVFQPPFFDGLHYEDNLTINAQEWKGSKWRGIAGEYIGFAALNEIETVFPAAIADQRYLIQQLDEQYWPPSIDLPNYTGPGQPWIVFDEDVVGTVNTCSQPWYNFIPEIKDIDIKVSEGNISGNYSTTLTWEAQRALFSKLKNANMDLSNYPEVLAFYTNAGNGAIEDFDFAKTEQKAVYTQEAALQNQLRNVKLEQKGLTAQIIALDSLLLLAPTATLWTDRSNLFALLADKTTEAVGLVNQIFVSRDIKAASTLIVNQNLLPVDIVQQNEQTFNDIYLNTLSKNVLIFTTTQRSNLFAIAEQCPLEGGRVVHKARSLYALIDADISFEKACVKNKALEKSDSDNKGNEANGKRIATKYGKSISIYPNPANDALMIKHEITKEGALVIFSAMGRMVQRLPLSPDKGLLKIDTRDWPEGLYFIKTYSGKEELSSDKIIIIH